MLELCDLTRALTFSLDNATFMRYFYAFLSILDLDWYDKTMEKGDLYLQREVFYNALQNEDFSKRRPVVELMLTGGNVNV